VTIKNVEDMTIEELQTALGDARFALEEAGARVEELEDALGDAQAIIDDLRASEEPYRALVDAVKVFLSWYAHPPAEMPPEEVAKIGRVLHSQLHDTLRAVS
jgi:hypothetical protein